MPPTGGQGGNAAVLDGWHLAWKLAAVLAGHAADRLLNSHDAERRPYADRLAEQQYANYVQRIDPGLADESVAEIIDPARGLFGYVCPSGAFLPEQGTPTASRSRIRRTQPPAPAPAPRTPCCRTAVRPGTCSAAASSCSPLDVTATGGRRLTGYSPKSAPTAWMPPREAFTVSRRAGPPSSAPTASSPGGPPIPLHFPQPCTTSCIEQRRPALYMPVAGPVPRRSAGWLWQRAGYGRPVATTIRPLRSFVAFPAFPAPVPVPVPVPAS